MLKHVLFDNDGTIVDTEILAVRTMLRMLSPLGFHMNEKEYCLRFPGLLERDILSIVEKEYGIQPSVDFLERLHNEHQKVFATEMRAIPGMTRLFRNLKTPKSMVSNANVRHVERCLKQVRLRPALKGHIFSAEHVERPKPHPDVYHLAIDTLQTDPSDMLVVEDSPTGVVAAKAAGLRVVGFLGASHVHDGHAETLLERGADFIAADAQALGLLLIGMGAL